MEQCVFKRFKDEVYFIDEVVDYHCCENSYIVEHTHDYWELFFVTRGSQYHSLNGELNVVNEKEIYLLKPDDRHHFNFKDNSESQIFTIIIEAEYFKGLCDILGDDCYLQLNSTKKQFILLDDLEFEDILSMLTKHSMLNRHNQDVYTSILQYIIGARIEFARKLLISSNLSCTVIANKVNYSEAHFCRLFKETVGYSPLEYRNRMLGKRE